MTVLKVQVCSVSYQQSSRMNHSMSDPRVAKFLADWVELFPQLVYSIGQVNIKSYLLVLVPNVFFSPCCCNDCLFILVV